MWKVLKPVFKRGYRHGVRFMVVPIALGIFETFIHTAGIWIHNMKKPYTPGLASAWPMGAL